MLVLKPSCENCNKALPPAADDAMICTYECTFCAHCVESVLQNVCPNCGGGFCPRPVRPAHDRVGGNFLGKHPASTTTVHRPVDASRQETLIAELGALPPRER